MPFLHMGNTLLKIAMVMPPINIKKWFSIFIQS